MKEKVVRNGLGVFRETKKWRGKLLYLTRDCDKITKNEIVKVRFSEQSLTRLVTKYNRCMGDGFTDIKSDKPWSKIEVGIALGVAINNIKTKNAINAISDLNTPFRAIEPLIGIQMDFSSPRISEKFSFRSEMHFMQTNYFSSVTYDRLKYQLQNDVSINLTTLSIPSALKYSIPAKNISMNILVGLNLERQLNYDVDISSYRIKEGTKEEVETHFSSIHKYVYVNNIQLGYFGGVEITKPFKNFNIGIALRHYDMGKIINMSSLWIAGTSRTSISFLVGIK